MPFRHYYAILGVNEGASDKEIKVAYRQLVLKYHPDRHNNAPYYQEKFKEIQRAYEALIKGKFSSAYSGNFKESYTRKKTIYESNVVRIRTDKNVMTTRETFKLDIRVKGTGNNIKINGLKFFTVIGHPTVKSDIELENGEMAYVSYFSYQLKPKQEGYLPVGPVYIEKGQYRFGSNSIFLKVGRNKPRTMAGKAKVFFSDKTEAVISAVVFLVLGSIFSLVLYNVFNPPDHPDFQLEQHSFRTFYDQNIPDWESINRLETGSHPFDEYFGKGEMDMGNPNGIRFLTGEFQDAVVLLVKLSNDEIVRNEYIQAGSIYEMRQVPDGTYYLKVILGRDWKPDAEFEEREFSGGFAEAAVYKIFDHPDFYIRMGNDDPVSSLSGYSFYEITLYPVRNGNYTGNRVNPNSFF